MSLKMLLENMNKEERQAFLLLERMIIQSKIECLNQINKNIPQQNNNENLFIKIRDLELLLENKINNIKQEMINNYLTYSLIRDNDLINLGNQLQYLLSIFIEINENLIALHYKNNKYNIELKEDEKISIRNDLNDIQLKIMEHIKSLKDVVKSIKPNDNFSNTKLVDEAIHWLKLMKVNIDEREYNKLEDNKEMS